jgi:DNA polymerase I-like protein with 3'-5' exonuclease and polymerase domains
MTKDQLEAVIKRSSVKGSDIYAEVASIAFGVLPNEVTSSQRRQAKQMTHQALYSTPTAMETHRDP